MDNLTPATIEAFASLLGEIAFLIFTAVLVACIFIYIAASVLQLFAERKRVKDQDKHYDQRFDRIEALLSAHQEAQEVPSDG